VHDRYAVTHHLPCNNTDARNGQQRNLQWKGNGEARLFCGYCWNFAAGKAVDPRAVFDNMEKFKRRLSEFRDPKEDGCCELM
jgi:hypothetical protein